MDYEKKENFSKRNGKMVQMSNQPTAYSSQTLIGTGYRGLITGSNPQI